MSNVLLLAYCTFVSLKKSVYTVVSRRANAFDPMIREETHASLYEHTHGFFLNTAARLTGFEEFDCYCATRLW